MAAELIEIKDRIRKRTLIATPNFQLVNLEGQMAEFELERREVKYDGKKFVKTNRWEHVSPGDLIALNTFIREIGFALRGKR